jgi:hypothetical protein
MAEREEGQRPEQFVDQFALLAGEMLKDKTRFVKMSGVENDPRVKLLLRELGGTIMDYLVDVAKNTMATRDEIISFVQDHEERIAQLEEESEGLPVIEEEDKALFLQVGGEAKGAYAMLIALADFARKPHNAAEYESQLRNIDDKVLIEATERVDKMFERVTELSTTEEEVEQAGEEEEEPEQAVAAAPGN